MNISSSDKAASSGSPQSSDGCRPSRREFMRQSTLALGAAAAVANQTLIAPRAHAAGSDILKVGLVGCGGRGGGAALQAITADENAKVHALADVFEDHLTRCLNSLHREKPEQIDVPPERRFVGLDGYKGVIETCDVVLLAAPPAFRPLHFRAAVDAGRHVFAEKPVAIDPVGVRSILRDAQRAREKNLSVVSGFCYRYQKGKLDTYAQLHEGRIGDIVTLQGSYNGLSAWYRDPRPEWSDMENCLRNWYYYSWLSGDFINEQAVHSMDKLAWAMRDEYPVACTASGGRSVRVEPRFGDIFDHFNATFEYANGVRAFTSCRQWPNSARDVSEHAFGTEGVAQLQAHRIERRDGDIWRAPRYRDDNMWQNGQTAFMNSVRRNEPIDDGETMAKSTMMSLMARMSAYTGQEVTWEMAMNSTLDLTPSSYALDAEPPEIDIPVPGRTPLV